jgi:undecaprenyl-diphosphatase
MSSSEGRRHLLLRRLALASTRRMLFWLTATLLAFGVFIDITHELAEGEVDAIDRAILLWIVKARTPWLDIAAIDLTALGSVTLVVLFSAFSLVVLIALRDRMGARQLLIASVGAGLLTLLTKNIVERSRPEVIPHLVQVSGFSYPSGHSLLTTALYVTIGMIAGRHVRHPRAKGLIFLSTSCVLIMVGMSRVYLGVHYPTDVVSGISLGGALALLIDGFFRLLNRRRSP